MDRAVAIKVIRDCFSHVEVQCVVVEYDPLIGEEVAKVLVRDDQLSEALRDHGSHAQRAAKQSGLSVEVVLAVD